MPTLPRIFSSTRIAVLGDRRALWRLWKTNSLWQRVGTFRGGFSLTSDWRQTRNASACDSARRGSESLSRRESGESCPDFGRRVGAFCSVFYRSPTGTVTSRVLRRRALAPSTSVLVAIWKPETHQAPCQQTPDAPSRPANWFRPTRFAASFARQKRWPTRSTRSSPV